MDIKARRTELGLTLEDIGNAVGVGKSTVRKWETGIIKDMRRDKIELLAKVLKVSPLDILGAPEQTPPLVLSEQEQDIIKAYRNQPEPIRQMICKMLDVSEHAIIQSKTRKSGEIEDIIKAEQQEKKA